MRRLLARTAWIALLLSVVLGVLLAATLWMLQQRLPAWQPELAAWASRTLGAPVQMGRIEVSWSARGPQLRLFDVEANLHGADLVVQRAALDVDWLRFLRERSLNIQGLHLTGAQLTLSTDFEDAWRGLQAQWPASEEATTSGLLNALDDFRLTIEQGRVIYRPQAQGPDYEFQELDVLLTHRAGRLNVEASTALPAQLGERLKVTAAAVLPRELNGLNGLGQAGAIPWRISVEGDSIVEHLRLEVLGDPETGQAFVFAADRVQLEELSAFIDWLPDGELRQQLAGLAPHGLLSELYLSLYRGVDGRLEDFHAQGVVQGGRWNASRDIPGVSGLSGRFEAQADGGRLQLDSEDVQLDHPSVFLQPMEIGTARGAFSWSREDGGWFLTGDDLRLDNTDFDAHGRLALRLPEDGAVWMELEVDLNRVELVGAMQWLPADLLAGLDAGWLERTFPAGVLRDGRVSLRGDLADFPFDDDGSGHFLVEGLFENATVMYSEEWPPVYDARGQLRFSGRGVSADVSAGRIIDSQILSGAMSIPDLNDPVLWIEAAVASDATRLLDFLRTSPLREQLGPLVDQARGTGPAQLTLELDLPLRDTSLVQWQGRVDLQGVTLGYGDFASELQRLRGPLLLDNGRVSSPALTGRLEGEDFTAQLASGENAGDPLRIQATGTISAATLKNQLPMLQDAAMFGVSAWEADIRIPSVAALEDGAPMQLQLMSDLRGLHLQLPAPLTHLAYQQRELSMELQLSDTQLLNFEGRLADDVQWRLGFAPDGDGNPQMRGHVHFGGGPPPPEQPGLTITGNVPVLDIEAWLALLGGPMSMPGGDGGDGLHSVALQAGVARGLGLEVHGLDLDMRRSADGDWRLVLDSDSVAGVVHIPADLQSGQPLRADMQRLILGDGQWLSPAAPASASTAASSAPELRIDPRSLPSLQLTVEEFGVAGMRFGRLQAQAQRVDAGLEITHLHTLAEHFWIEAQGSWTHDPSSPAGSRMAVDLRMQSSDVGAMLRTLGYDLRAEAEHASLGLNVAWEGAPFSRHWLDTMQGELNVEVGRGWLADVDPGAGRVLGLMSLAALPRRLALDFRDVFGEGLIFDGIQGDFLLLNGDAYTDNLRLHGPAGNVEVLGRTGLSRRDYEQQALVTANVGMTLLPFVGGLLGGAGAGAAIMLFQEIFSAPLRDIGRVTYCISGPWDAPDVRRLGVEELQQGLLCADLLQDERVAIP